VVNKLDAALSFQTQALGLRAQRQQILAGNIANADTPNYKARDFDFSIALKEAVAGRNGGGLALATTAGGHIQAGADAISARLMYRTPGQASVDGNTVEMDVERAQFSENAIQYEAGITFISGQIKTLLSAMQSQ
jgi:flagellar basal-body rod protein FlgB